MCTVQAWHWCKKWITCPLDQEDGLQTARQYYLLVSRIEQELLELLWTVFSLEKLQSC